MKQDDGRGETRLQPGFRTVGAGRDPARRTGARMNPMSLIALPPDLLKAHAERDALSPHGERHERRFVLATVLLSLLAALALVVL